MACLLAGCGPARTAPDLRQRQHLAPDALERLPLPVIDFGTPVPGDAPRAIVSVIPSMTEVVFALGLGDRLVARSDYCDWPPEVATRPALGSQQTLALERVANLHPDLVIWWESLPDQVRMLREVFHLQVITPATENRAQVFDGIRSVATFCHVAARGEALVAEIQQGLARVKAAFASTPRRRVLLVLDRGDVLYLPGRNSFLQEIFDITGAENVAAGLDDGNWPKVGLERVLDWDPEVIIDLSISGTGAAALGDAAAYWERHPELRAVREGHVVLISAGVMVRPGPRLAAVAEMFGRLVRDA